ncbi:hypothetical protein [Delftia phage PhiW-14]|uniref:Uncharacterized protein n=1 Tax=Delftia phage PhiW-14 TaxID=665032 RepID=C9DG71_BPW14|nr:hypothetical protein DP-phiW-14_gp101 [Delftia phage PhiW-14]ACV50122.1 hypothetical protein [Delftia phage PhiW-14]
MPKLITFKQVLSNRSLSAAIQAGFVNGGLQVEVRVLRADSDDDGVWDAWYKIENGLMVVEGSSGPSGSGDDLRVVLSPEGSVIKELSSAGGWEPVGLIIQGDQTAVAMIEAILAA